MATVLLPPPRDMALLDADGGRNAGDQIHLRAGQLLDELAGIEVHRVQKSPLPLGKEQVKGQRALAGAADAGDHDELPRGMASEIFFRLCSRAP